MFESAKEITDQMQYVLPDSGAFSKNKLPIHVNEVHLVTYDFIAHDGLFSDKLVCFRLASVPLECPERCIWRKVLSG